MFQRERTESGFIHSFRVFGYPELELFIWLLNRAIARALIGGGGGVYSYIRVLRD